MGRHVTYLAATFANLIFMSTAARAAEYILECKYEVTLPGEKATDKRLFYVDPAQKSVRMDDPKSRIRVTLFGTDNLEFAQITAGGTQSFTVDQRTGGLIGEACVGPPAAVDQGACFIKLKFNGQCMKQDAAPAKPGAAKK